MTRRKNNHGHYIVETVVLGGSMKVSIFDPETLTEVSVVVPPNTTRKEGSDLALRKLQYLLKKGKNK